MYIYIYYACTWGLVEYYTPDVWFEHNQSLLQSKQRIFHQLQIARWQLGHLLLKSRARFLRRRFLCCAGIFLILEHAGPFLYLCPEGCCHFQQHSPELHQDLIHEKVPWEMGSCSQSALILFHGLKKNQWSPPRPVHWNYSFKIERFNFFFR